MNVLIYLVVLAVLYALWALMVRAGTKRLRCDRAFSCPAAFAGEEGEFVEVIRNESPFAIPWLRLECRIPEHLRLGRQDNLYNSAQMYYSSLFTLMPYQQVRRTHRVQFLHRGAYDLGQVSMTVGDVLGLFQFRRKQVMRCPVLVYPRLLEEKDLPAPVFQMLGEVSSRRQLQEDPFLVRGIRPYQPGDPVRDIHWPATARVGQTQVRVRDYTARARLLVVLNAQAEQIQWHDRIPEKKEAVMEYGISLAATLCSRALRSGMSAGFAANMPMNGSGESTVLLPGSGAAREEELLAAFARLDLVRTQPFPLLLDALTRYTDLDILVLSCYESDEIREAVTRLRRRGNQVTFHRLEGGGV